MGGINHPHHEIMVVVFGAGAGKVPCVHGHFGLMVTLTITENWWF